jgi:hypothetical protein
MQTVLSALAQNTDVLQEPLTWMCSRRNRRLTGLFEVRFCRQPIYGYAVTRPLVRGGAVGGESI